MCPRLASVGSPSFLPAAAASLRLNWSDSASIRMLKSITKRPSADVASSMARLQRSMCWLYLSIASLAVWRECRS